jgi:beta-glucosidase
MAKIPLITILFSGRPMLVQDSLELSEAFIAAWLPGTTGGMALSNSIFGHY